MAAEKAREWVILLFAAHIDLKKVFDHVDRNQALKATKEHGVDKQQPGMDLEQFRNEAWTLQVKKIQNNKKTSARSARNTPRCSHYWWTQCLQHWATNGEERDNYVFKLDGWYCTSVAHCEPTLWYW